MSRQYLNLTGFAWRQLRRNWRLKPTPMLVWQTWAPGSVFSFLAGMQRSVHSAQVGSTKLNNAVVVLGYWRSGTTLLHELLCLDSRYTYPTTHACMNPHHFLFTEASALASGGASAQRPMDEMEVRAGSPQEDEFALLSLGARSPYEALIYPSILQEALKLTDPLDLSEADRKHWREVFVNFLSGVAVRGGGRPMVLKSPTHGARVATLRELLPDARYILIVRDPVTNFESVVRMWKKMFETYAFGTIPSDDEIREAVLIDRPRFESKLASTTKDIPQNRFAAITYESLVESPIARIEELYNRLELGDFTPVKDAIAAEMQKRREYKAKGALPAEAWRERINRDWAEVIARHASLRA